MGFVLPLYVRTYNIDKLHIGKLLFVWIEFGSVPISVSEACRLRDAVAKLIKNLTLYYYSSFFFTATG